MALSVTSAPWQQVNSPSLDIRRWHATLVSSEGIATSGDMAVTQNGTPNMTVNIAAGKALVKGDAVTEQGYYLAYNDATFNLTGFTAAHATLPRIDRVVIRVRDAFHGDAANDESFQILTGTATSGATLANLTGATAVGNSQLLLANILVPATATTITTANIGNVATVLATTSGSGSKISHTTVTAPVTGITASTEGTAVTVLPGESKTYDGSEVRVEISWPGLLRTNAAGASGDELAWATFVLLRDSAVVGQHQRLGANVGGGGGGEVSIFDTPTAGAHTYSVKLFVAATYTFTFSAGAGAAGNLTPAFLRISKA